MKVTLINPAQLDSKYKFMGVVAPPLGLAYMAAVLEENDIEVNIIDACALELSLDDIAYELNPSPEIIAITALTPTIGKALETANFAKKTCPDAMIVMGGYHPTFNYKEILDHEYVDVVIMGEGENTLLDLAKTVETGGSLKDVKGLAFGDIITTTRPLIDDLDDLPLPARHLLPMESYKLLNMETRMSTMITSRGCPMQCSFCSSAALHGHKLRLRSVDKILDEMEYLVNELNVETIAFMDDTFTLNKNRVLKICEGIKERNINVLWGCTARVDTLNSEVLKRMGDAGCITIFMGVESADQQILDDANKQTTIEKIRNAFEISRKEKIRTIASVVIGMPGDTQESIKKTINFVKELNPSYAIFSLATPYPGTKFYQQTFEKDIIKVKDWSKYTLISPILETVDCSLDELKKLQITAFKKFYLRPVYLIRQIIMDGPMLLKTIFGVLRNIVMAGKS